MRFLKGVLCGLILSSFIHGWLFGWAEWKERFREKWEQEIMLPTIEQKFVGNQEYHSDIANGEKMEHEHEKRLGNDKGDRKEQQRESATRSLELGMTEQELEGLLGNPTRRELTPYGYEWWIYDQDWTEYIQIGMRAGLVNTYYTNSPTWGWAALYPSLAKDKWSGQFPVEEEVSFRHQSGFYTFNLSAEEQKARPLWLDGDVAIQVYVDLHNSETISGVRVMDLDTLLIQRPYALKYIGELPEVPALTAQEWLEVAKAKEQQVFTLVNIVRRQHGLPALAWDEHVAYVARGHSADMLANNFFDHDSPSQGDLAARLNREQVTYIAAGENIAWNYVDAPDAHEGWLNSLGHRKNVFRKEFTHLGVGVVEKYYTQNFITH